MQSSSQTNTTQYQGVGEEDAGEVIKLGDQVRLVVMNTRGNVTGAAQYPVNTHPIRLSAL